MAHSPERARRLSPDERRSQIIDAARDLFAERPFTSVTTADVAAAAGVARSLVHHYFGGIRELFLAVAAAGVEGLPDVTTLGAEASLDQRTAHNLRAGLDVIDATRQTWLAVVGQASGFGDPDIAALLRATNEHSIEATIASNEDLIADTPEVRFALRCYQGFAVEAIRGWLEGEVTREQAESLLRVQLRELLATVIPEWREGSGEGA